MRKFIFLALSAMLVASCGNSKKISKKDMALDRSFIESYMTLVKERPDYDFKLVASDWLSPVEIKERGLSSHALNFIYLSDFEYIGYDAEKGEYIYHFFATGWRSEYTFKVIKHEGKRYFEGGEISKVADFVDPWKSTQKLE